MPCRGRRTSILGRSPAQGDAVALLQVLHGLHVGKTRRVEQRADRLALVPTVLDQQPTIRQQVGQATVDDAADVVQAVHTGDRKSTRLNSSHSQISYAVFCL